MADASHKNAYTIERYEDEKQTSEIAAVGADSFSETFGHLYKPEDLEAFLTKSHSEESYRQLLAEKDYAVWIARDESGDAVGYAVAGPSHLPIPDKPESAGELVRLYILSAHQGGGLGGRLLEMALSWLEARFENLYISVFSENFGAQRLYARYGFEKIHEYHFMVGEQADLEFIMMRKVEK